MYHYEAEATTKTEGDATSFPESGHDLRLLTMQTTQEGRGTQTSGESIPDMLEVTRGHTTNTTGGNTRDRNVNMTAFFACEDILTEDAEEPSFPSPKNQQDVPTNKTFIYKPPSKLNKPYNYIPAVEPPGRTAP